MTHNPQRPANWLPAAPLGPQSIPGQGTPGVTADSLGDGIRPFLVSGGSPQFLVVFGEGFSFDPRPAGIQMVCSVYVPPGTVGFVKQIRIGPYCPPVLVDPWRTTGVQAGLGTWSAPLGPDGGNPAAGTNGIWETPMGWQRYADPGEQFPEWQWMLRVVKGNVIAKYQNTPQFDVTDPTTWDYVPFPVPRAAYAGTGVPGSPPGGGTWQPNTMQAIPGAPLETHAIVPENTTVMLFATWKQSRVTPRAEDFNGPIVYGDPVYPLLPTYGQLHGYMQSDGAGASEVNARTGWGG